MEKIICFIGAFVLGTVLLYGCGTGNTPLEQEGSAGNYRIVCTTFPQYDWVMNLLEDVQEDFDVTLLVKNSADIHNYQPSAQDMIAIKEADLFIYVGGESDAWVQDLLAADSALTEHSVSILEVLGDAVLTQEQIHEMLYQGHEHEEEHDSEHGQEHAHEHDETLPDEHVWLSLEKAEILCGYISGRLIAMAPEYEKEISANTLEYTAQLSSLGEEYADTIAASEGNPLIFGDRFPFGYLAEEYDLVCSAAYVGCSAEVEVGFDTVISLAEQVNALEAEYVLVIDGSDRSLADTIIGTAGADNVEILELNSMQSVSLEDIQAGASYLGIMRENLEILRKALG